MEPNKFEEGIKKRLREREILPSDQAWKKITDRLDSERAPQGRRVPWWGVAASVIGLLLVIALWFERESQPLQEIPVQVVTTPEVKPVATEKPQERPREMRQTLQEELQLHADKPVTATSVPQKDRTERKPVTAVVASQQGLRAMDSPVEASLIVDDTASWESNTKRMMAVKIDEVIAKVDALEASESALSDAEVDSLLRAAQRELLADAAFQKGEKIDAMSLLANVEDELDQSFRDQIFEKLKTGFLKVRTAVAQRNN